MSAESVIDSSDAAFLEAFEAQSLNGDCWTHEAHLRMAWIVCRMESSVDDAIARARSGIQKFNAANGKSDKYHETVTVAYMRLMWDRLKREGDGGRFEAFRDAQPDLFERYPGPLLAHYSREILETRESMEAFVQPDREPLPQA